MNFLVIKPSSLGDIIHTFPAVDLIRRARPEGTITWVVNECFAGMVDLCPAVDEIVVFQRKKLGQMRHLPKLISFLAELRQHPHDVAIDFQGLLRSGVMAFASGAPRRVGFENAREGAGLFYNEKVMLPANLRHAVDKNLFLARAALGMPDVEADFELPRQHDLAKCARQLMKGHPVGGNGPVVAVAPASRWPSKTWPLRFFAEVLDEVAARQPGVRCWVLGTPDEKDHCARLGELCRNCRFLNLAGETDLGTLTELLRASDVLVTNDSGPMHLAAAVETPTVAFFGATDPELTGPYGDRHRVIRSTCDLMPCFSRECLQENRACSDGTSPGEVAEAVLSHLGAKARRESRCEPDPLLKETTQ